MWEIIILILLVLAIFLLVYRTRILKEDVDNLQQTVNDLGDSLALEMKTSNQLRAQLTEALDREESYKLVIEKYKSDQQALPSSTQYPVAPPNLSPSKVGKVSQYNRDEKGHFIKKR